MAAIYFIISIVAFSLCGAFFLASVFLWFQFDVLKIIGDLSGRTAKKSIEQMREKNEKSGSKPFKPSTVNKNRGKITEIIPKSARFGKKGGLSKELSNGNTGAGYTGGTDDTVLLEEQRNTTGPGTVLLAEGTALLSESEGTAVLGTSSTVVLSPDSEEKTEPLPGYGQNTNFYTGRQDEMAGAKRSQNFRITEDILIVHTDETI